MRGRLLVAAIGVFAMAGCGSDSSGPPSASATATAPGPPSASATATAPGTPSRPRPALCGPLDISVTGSVRTQAATELSGLALSNRQQPVLWTHNDSGDSPRILALTPEGELLAEVAVSSAESEDWEEIAIAGKALYIADIGDNAAQRRSITVYALPEPAVTATTASATRMSLRYADGPRDAEALLVDPSNGSLVVVTKSFSGIGGVYVAKRGATTLRRAGAISLGTGEAVTAGSLSGDGRTIVLRTYDRAFLWRRSRGQSIAAALRRRPCAARAGLLREGQGEAIALDRSARAFYTVPEGAAPAIRRYRAR